MAEKLRTRAPAETVDDVAFRDMCRKFAAAEVAPRWEQADRDSHYPIDFYHAAARAGLIGMTAPTALGGAGLGVHETVVFMEEGSKINPNLPVSVLIQEIAGGLLADFGQGELHDIVRRNIAGDCLLALAVTEPEAGSDIQNVKCSARRDGDDWIIDGQKAFISLAGYAEVLVVLAQTDPSKGRHGMSFFAVDRKAAGVTMRQLATYANRPVPTYVVDFKDVRVPAERQLSGGFREIMAGFNRERLLVAARWLGHMQHAMEWAREYAQTRHQFGKPIGSNQSIAFMLAQGHVDVEATRSLTYAATRRWDSGVAINDIILEVSTAKLFATQAVYRITQNALHIGGGWGLTEDLPVMRMALDALVAPVTVGSYEIQLRVIARQLGLPCD